MKSLLLLLLPALLFWGVSQKSSKEITETPKIEAGDSPSFALLELFTSQGCSSCPPADEQLAAFAERAAEGEEIYALSYHVDYWNYLGWEDPYSDARFSQRQRAYANQLSSRVYTPQLVVNGSQEMIGSRKRETEAAVNSALSKKATYTLAFDQEVMAGKVKVSYEISGGNLPKDSRIVAVAAQPEASRSVKRGENRGKELRHVNVVRAFNQEVITGNSGTITLALPAGLEEYDIVVFLQSGEAGEVLAAKK